MSRRTRSPENEPRPALGRETRAKAPPPPAPWADLRSKEPWLWIVALALLLPASAVLSRPFATSTLVHVGYFLYVVSSAVHHELALRAMGLTAALLFLNSSVRAAAWSDLDPWSVGSQLVLLALSTRHSVALCLRHTPFRFSAREAALHEAVFAKHHVSLEEFHALLTLNGARWARVAPGERRALAHEGAPARELVLLASGEGVAEASRGGVQLESLAPGALVGERGLSAFDCAADSDAAAVCDALSPVTVTCVGPLEYVSWPKRALVQHLAARPGARACIMALVAQDESRKLRAAEGKLVADEQ